MKKPVYLVLATICITAITIQQSFAQIKDVNSEAIFYSQKDSPYPFSKAVRAGDFVYFSGMIGTGADGKLVTGFEAQAKQTMENIAAGLKAQGLTMNDVVKCTVMIADMPKWAAFNVIYRTYFKEGHFPARSAFGANGLAMGADMEVEVIAYDPKR